MIQFLLNDELVSLNEVETDLTVLNYLRDVRKLTGSKEGCAAGDCGACTVVLAELNATQDDVHYRSINSCLTFMSALAGKQLITVEHLAGDVLHPVQQAMLDHHASQCGFCSPGFVMSLFALYQQECDVSREEVVTALSGNLCRCTGYRPIIDAALDVCAQDRQQATDFEQQKQQTLQTLQQLAVSEIGEGAQCQQVGNLFMPTNTTQLMQLITTYPKAQWVAGGTDLALQVTQQWQPIKQLISLTHIKTLQRMEVQEQTLVIGAACPLTDIQPLLTEYWPELTELLQRFASLPIRNQATLGGNIANASPIGDMPPVLLALGASVKLDNGQQQRVIPLKDFFVAYRQTVLADKEWIDSVVIPLPVKQADQHLCVYKVSKRYEDDISAVCAAFRLVLQGDKVTELDTGFGGVAATPAVCDALLEALSGKSWHKEECLTIGQKILAQAFEPIDDVRASASYRRMLLSNLWQRFWLETNQAQNKIAVRLVDEVQHA